jgi:C4-dicarboxylate transporter DctM subunit
MDPVYIALLTVGLLLVTILLGMHVGVALATLGVLGLMFIKGNPIIAFHLLGDTAYEALMDYVFGAMPMFVIMGVFANLSGASEDLYSSANVLLSRLRGGLGIATVIANALFAAITGISVASAAVFSAIAIPQMKRLGYDRRFALGTVAGSSVLGMLIPPSFLLIVYGLLTEEAIGRLFIAGVLPGLVMTAIYSIGIYAMVLVKPHLGGQRETGSLLSGGMLKEVFRPWVFACLIALVLGGLWLGWFTPTEAGAIGAFGAFLAALFRGRLTWRTLWEALLDSAIITASIYFLIMTAQVYSKMLTISGLPMVLSGFFASMAVSPLVVIALFVIIFLLLGAIIDSTSILLVTIPLMLPVIKALGMDPIWFGIVSIVAVEVGLITPPFGMAIFAMKAALGDEVNIEDIFIGSFPFIIMMLVTLAIIILFPPLSTYLPSLM